MRTSLLALLLSASARAAAPPEVLAVLSSDSPYYREAYEGFVEAFGEPVPAVSLDANGGPGFGPGLRLAAVFGSAAARVRYPEHVRVVACLAPGAEDPRPEGEMIRVALVPPPERLLDALRGLQPGLIRLAVLWRSPRGGEYAAALARAGGAAGVEVLGRRVSADGIPGALRELGGREQALWIPPDPALVTPANFAVLVEYSRANKKPFYAPTAALVAEGAAAAAAVSFRESGRAAGRAAREALVGRPGPAVVYPEKVELVVHPEAARLFGLAAPPAGSKP